MNPSQSTIDLGEAARFIELLTGSADTPVTFQTFHDKNKDDRKVSRIRHGTLAQHSDELTRLNQGGGGVFVMVNQGDGEGRSEAHVTGIRAVFIDCDDPGLDPLGSIDRAKFDPDFMVESSPGKFHAYRRVSNFPVEKDLFKGFQLTLADRVQGDPAVQDLARVLRVPGFLHQKPDKVTKEITPFKTRIHQVGELRRVTSYSALLAEFGLSETDLITRAGVEAGDKAGTKATKAKAKEATHPRALVDWEAEFAKSLRDGEGRNNHAIKLAGWCAGSGLSLEASMERLKRWNTGNVEPLLDVTIEELVPRIWHKERDKRAAYPLTEVGFSQRFSASYSDRLIYLKDASLWMHWDEFTWGYDEGEVVVAEAVKAEARALLTEAASTMEDSKRQALVAFNRTMERARAVQATMQLAKSDPAFSRHSSQMDADPFLLATSNCIIDLRTGATTANSPDLMLTNRCMTAYDPEADCPTWKKHIEAVACGDPELIAFIQRVLGYCLTASVREHKMFFFVGDGSNGKSTTLNVIARLMGGYFRKVPAKAIMVQRKGAGGPSEDIAQLRGCRFALTGELVSGNQLDEGLIKDIVSDDPLTARLMYKSNVTFKPTHKLVSATNILPTIAGNDNGIWRRICVVPFNATFTDATKDPRMDEKLDAEFPGILNWLIDGCLEWQRDGLQEPESVKAETQEYRNDLDVIGRFISEACYEEEGEYRYKVSVQSSALFASYVKYCNYYHLPMLSFTKWGKEMGKRFRRVKSGIVSYAGLQIKDVWKAEDAIEAESPDSELIAAADSAAAEARAAVFKAAEGR